MIADQQARMFAALGHETRLRLCRILLEPEVGELAAGEIAGRLEISAPLASHHLASLAGAGCIVMRKDGRNMMFRADRDRLRSLGLLLA